MAAATCYDHSRLLIIRHLLKSSQHPGIFQASSYKLNTGVTFRLHSSPFFASKLKHSYDVYFDEENEKNYADRWYHQPR